MRDSASETTFQTRTSDTFRYVRSAVAGCMGQDCRTRCGVSRCCPTDPMAMLLHLQTVPQWRLVRSRLSYAYLTSGTNQIVVPGSGAFHPAFESSLTCPSDIQSTCQSTQGVMPTQHLMACDSGHCSGDNTFSAPCLQYHSSDSKQDLQARLNFLQNPAVQLSFQQRFESSSSS